MDKYIIKKLLNRVDVANARKTIVKAMDKDPSLYYGYQANIVMAFFDEVKRNNVDVDDELLRQMANNAAIHFLNNWAK